MIDYNRLLFKVAFLYYEKDMTQFEIAKRLSISRQKVQRLLQQARNERVVRIVIHPIPGAFSNLEGDLEQNFGLREAIVVETSDYYNQLTVAKEVGAGAAEYLLRVIQPNSKIVISWGGTLLGMVNAISSNPKKDFEGVMVIQGLGGIADPTHEAHAADLTRRLARSLKAQAVLLPAPGIAGSRNAHEAFCKDYYVAEALNKARTADLAFMGIGAPRQDSILVQQGNIVDWEEITKLMEKGAVGDINLRYFDKNGQMIPSDLDDRVIGLTLEEIKKIAHIIGIAGGSVKLNAIRGALKGKLIDVLVTDHITAQKLLDSN